ncbi:hypothetical protein SVIOM74S_03199 [Streptomyces violarus]
MTTFLVSPTAFRRYTPDAVDTVTGRMSILFHRHSAVVPGPTSPGDAWLDSLTAGDPVSAMGLEAMRVSVRVPNRAPPSCAAMPRPWACGTR